MYECGRKPPTKSVGRKHPQKCGRKPPTKVWAETTHTKREKRIEKTKTKPQLAKSMLLSKIRKLNSLKYDKFGHKYMPSELFTYETKDGKVYLQFSVKYKASGKSVMLKCTISKTQKVLRQTQKRNFKTQSRLLS